jgi:hypothetical protein
MSNTDTRTGAAPGTETRPGFDDEASPQDAADPEEPVEEALVEEEEEPEEEEIEEIEAAIEAELEAEDEAAVAEDAVLDLLLRRSGVLPQEAETGPLEEEELALPLGRGVNDFVCSRCFLIKPRSLLGDPTHRVCRDCLDPPEAEHAV